MATDKIVYLRTEPALSEEALVNVYLAVRPKIERVIARRVGSTTLASDLAQEMFFRIGTIKAELHSVADAERFFMRIAVNASFDHLKVEGRRREILRDAGSLFNEPPVSPERETLARDEVRYLNDSLSELPAKCREILMLSKFDGLSHAEIADRMGVSVSLVEKYAIRALVHCRRKLAELHGNI